MGVLFVGIAFLSRLPPLPPPPLQPDQLPGVPLPAGVGLRALGIYLCVRVAGLEEPRGDADGRPGASRHARRLPPKGPAGRRPPPPPRRPLEGALRDHGACASSKEGASLLLRSRSRSMLPITLRTDLCFPHRGSAHA